MAEHTSVRKQRRQSKRDAGNLLLVGLLMALVVALAAGLFWVLTSPSFLVPGR
jgi:hypothetical protein